MALFDWRSPLGPRPSRPDPGTMRGPLDDGLAPAPTAPFGDLSGGLDRPALPSLGAQDPMVLQVNLARLRGRDPAFDTGALARLAAEAMLAVERAWSTLDPQPSRAYLAPPLWASHRARMELYALHGRRNVVDHLQVHDARVVAVEQDAGSERITVRIRASSTDYDVDGGGAVVRGDTAVRTWEEDWVLQRGAGASSRPEGGLLGGHCPACGAPLQLDGDGRCAFCQAAPTDATHDWVVTGVSDVSRQDTELRAILGVHSYTRVDPLDSLPATEVVPSPFSAVAPSPAGPDVLAPLRQRDPGVDAASVVAAARTAFVAVQTALRSMDAAPARPVVTEETLDALAAGIASAQQAGGRHAGDDPLVESCSPIAAAADAQWETVTVRVVATLVDADVDARGAVVRGDLDTRRRGYELSMRRRIPGTDPDVCTCPRCGAPLQASVTGVCAFCRDAVVGGGSDWVLAALPVQVADRAGAAAAAPVSTEPPASPLGALSASDPALNEAELLARVRECFYAVEGALGHGDAAAAAHVVTPSFGDALRAGMARMRDQHRRRVLAFIDIAAVRAVAAEHGEGGDRVVARIDISGEDCTVDADTGAVVAGSDVQRTWSEDWTLLRAGASDPWLVDAVSASPG